MKDLNLITCIVQRGRSDDVVNGALKAGAQGATIYYGRGTGVRQRVDTLAGLIVPEKEIILIVTKSDQTDRVFEAIIRAAQLDKKGLGFAFVQKVDKAIGFLDE